MWDAQQQANVKWLFETQAFKVAPAEQPFSFTSGLLGPYFIATHFLCGGADCAEDLLDYISEHGEDRSEFPLNILSLMRDVYTGNQIYKSVIDLMAALAAEAFPLSEITHVAGGQRRDWFFSPLIAEKLEKPCLYIYNDQSVVDEEGVPVESLEGAQVLHVADLLTVGSSYVKKWCPAVSNLGGKLLFSLNCVDRAQQGTEALSECGVLETASLFVVSPELFSDASELGLIEHEQEQMLLQYLDDPYTTMREFLLENPDFLTDALASNDEKVRSRTQLLLDEDVYNLKNNS